VAERADVRKRDRQVVLIVALVLVVAMPALALLGI
jgi:hypothetical protein